MKNRAIFWLHVFGLGLALFRLPAVAEQAVLDATEDTELDSHINHRERPLGSEPALVVGEYPQDYANDPTSYALLRWDLSEIADTATVAEARLKLAGHDWSSGGVEVYAVAKGSWRESSVTWESWEATDKEYVLLGEFVSAGVASSKGSTTFSSDALTQCVQDWVAGRRENLGLFLKMSGSGRGRQDTFSSRETVWEHGHAPQLIVQYAGGDAKEDGAVQPPSEPQAVPGQILKGYTGDVAPVLDLDHDMVCFFHSRELLERKIRLLAESGFKRLYVIAPPAGEADYSAPALQQDGPPNFLRQSREALGDDPLKLSVQYAKQAGMEVFITFKPYEGGGVYTVPHDADPPGGRNALPTLGGQAVGLDPFLVRNPQMRVMRRPIQEHRDAVADRIEMVFVLDRIPGNEGLKVDRGKMQIVMRPGHPALDPQSVEQSPVEVVKLFTSTDNGTYQPYAGDFQIAERVERRLIRNANGELVFPRAVLCRVVELTGLALQTPYFAVELEAEGQSLRTIPFSESCFTLYSGTQVLPITVSPKVRPGILTGRYGFDNNGFDFNEQAPMYWDVGWRTQTLFGVARGKDTYVRGGLCEAYPEVRQYWLDQIAQFIDMGCDGVDVRLQNHSAGMPDFVNYGFNPRLIRAYEEKYGLAPGQPDSDIDPIKMMHVRGDFFTMFLEDAAGMLHQHGLTLQVHLNDHVIYPTLDPTFPGAGFWAAAKIVPDWRRVVAVADEISIKDYNWGVYQSHLSGKIKDETAAAGKPLWVHCYMQQGHDLNPAFLDQVQRDNRVTGLLLYEVVYRPGNVLDGLIDITADGEVRYVPDSPFDVLRLRSDEPR